MLTLSEHELCVIEKLKRGQARIAVFLSACPHLINATDNDLVRAVWLDLDPEYNCSTAIRYRRLLKSNPGLPSFASYDQEAINEAERANAYHWSEDGQARNKHAKSVSSKQQGNAIKPCMNLLCSDNAAHKWCEDHEGGCYAWGSGAKDNCKDYTA